MMSGISPFFLMMSSESVYVEGFLCVFVVTTVDHHPILTVVEHDTALKMLMFYCASF